VSPKRSRFGRRCPRVTPLSRWPFTCRPVIGIVRDSTQHRSASVSFPDSASLSIEHRHLIARDGTPERAARKSGQFLASRLIQFLGRSRACVVLECLPERRQNRHATRDECGRVRVGNPCSRVYSMLQRHPTARYASDPRFKTATSRSLHNQFLFQTSDRCPKFKLHADRGRQRAASGRHPWRRLCCLAAPFINGRAVVASWIQFGENARSERCEAEQFPSSSPLHACDHQSHFSFASCPSSTCIVDRFAIPNDDATPLLSCGTK